MTIDLRRFDVSRMSPFPCCDEKILAAVQSNLIQGEEKALQSSKAKKSLSNNRLNLTTCIFAMPNREGSPLSPEAGELNLHNSICGSSSSYDKDDLGLVPATLDELLPLPGWAPMMLSMTGDFGHFLPHYSVQTGVVSHPSVFSDFLNVLTPHIGTQGTLRVEPTELSSGPKNDISMVEEPSLNVPITTGLLLERPWTNPQDRMVDSTFDPNHINPHFANSLTIPRIETDFAVSEFNNAALQQFILTPIYVDNLNGLSTTTGYVIAPPLSGNAPMGSDLLSPPGQIHFAQGHDHWQEMTYGDVGDGRIGNELLLMKFKAQDFRTSFEEYSKTMAAVLSSNLYLFDRMFGNDFYEWLGTLEEDNEARLKRVTTSVMIFEYVRGEFWSRMLRSGLYDGGNDLPCPPTGVSSDLRRELETSPSYIRFRSVRELFVKHIINGNGGLGTRVRAYVSAALGRIFSANSKPENFGWCSINQSHCAELYPFHLCNVSRVAAVYGQSGTIDIVRDEDGHWLEKEASQASELFVFGSDDDGKTTGAIEPSFLSSSGDRRSEAYKVNRPNRKIASRQSLAEIKCLVNLDVFPHVYSDGFTAELLNLGADELQRVYSELEHVFGRLIANFMVEYLMTQFNGLVGVGDTEKKWAVYNYVDLTIREEVARRDREE
ncbi:hypothetical protein BJ742DRAFT_436894 [Cladochytrium replicatum]|nr:hypothetical protein BJ742DRAFT_436894 [Cladochytrium replicatum]